MFNNPPLFFWTSTLPCPYLKGRREKRIVAELGNSHAEQLHDELSEVGFRRSHGVVYKPACPNCRECIPVRIVLSDFLFSRSQKRVWTKNNDLIAEILPPVASEEQFKLFSKYQLERHPFGDMSRMSLLDYQSMIEETPIKTLFVEFRDQNNSLTACLLLDQISNGVSAVYSFFNPEIKGRSLGKFMILWLIKFAREQMKSFVYLGFWVKGSDKMNYKTNFKPLEYFTSNGWVKEK